MIKSISGDMSVPMVTTRSLPMTRGYADDMEGEPGGCRLVCGVVRIRHGRIVLCFP